MAEYGVIITAATLTILVAEVLRQRRAPLPAHGWLGILSLAGAEWLMFRRVEPVATFFTPIAWSAYILIADAAVFAVSRRSRIRDAPRPFLRMAALSIPLWLVFEAYNLRLRNWTYVGAPRFWPAALLGYAWSFATITPAIFETCDLIQSLLPLREFAAVEISRAAQRKMMVAGAACLVLPLILPGRIAAYLFALLWIGFPLLLDPLNYRLGWPSFIGDFGEGLRGRFYAFLLSGWVCGWLWEFWNYWAAAKWQYIFPMFQHAKIFEMPAPGYLGFPPFALDCFVMYVFALGLLQKLKKR
ncbi:MAG: hypothetical protein WA755_12470 [Candidatus Acidiferrales bacterium]